MDTQKNNLEPLGVLIRPGGGGARATAVAGIALAVAGFAVSCCLILGGRGDANPHHAFYRACAMVGAAMDVWLAVAAAGAMALRNWGRRWLLWWSVTAILYAIGRLVAAMVWLAPRATAAAKAKLAGAPPTEFGPDFDGMMVAVSAAGVSLVLAAFPIIVLCVFLRRSVREQYADVPLAHRVG